MEHFASSSGYYRGIQRIKAYLAPKWHPFCVLSPFSVLSRAKLYHACMAIVAHRTVLIVVSRVACDASGPTSPIDVFVPVAFSSTTKDETLIV